MQQFKVKLKNTPTDTPLVCSSVNSVLNRLKRVSLFNLMKGRNFSMIDKVNNNEENKEFLFTIKIKTCPTCGGDGKFMSNGISSPCSLCEGSGKVCPVSNYMIEEKILKKKFDKFVEDQVDIPKKYINIINDNFWDLL